MTPRGGIILRLIDVVLNLLFGIMCLSEVQRISDVKLPTARQIPAHPPSPNIVVGLFPDGSLRGDDDSPLAADSLAAYLDGRRAKMAGEDVALAVVDIYADREACFKDLQVLRDVCQRLGLPQRVTVVTEVASASNQRSRR